MGLAFPCTKDGRLAHTEKGLAQWPAGRQIESEIGQSGSFSGGRAPPTCYLSAADLHTQRSTKRSSLRRYSTMSEATALGRTVLIYFKFE